MITANDLRQFATLVPGRFSVTYTPKNPVAAGFSVPGTRRQDLKILDTVLAANVRITETAKVFILPFAGMAGVVPKLNDLINDGASNWTVDGTLPSIECGGSIVEYKVVCNKAR